MSSQFETRPDLGNSQKNRKILFGTPNPFEKKFGYYRAVRKGPFVFVSGTTAVKLDAEEMEPAIDGGDGDRTVESKRTSQVHYPGDARKQATLAMERCIDAVRQLGGCVEDVVRVRMFVANHDDCSEVGRAFRDNFAGESPTQDQRGDMGAAATMVVMGNGFVDPDMLVEVEVDAVILD